MFPTNTPNTCERPERRVNMDCPNVFLQPGPHTMGVRPMETPWPGRLGRLDSEPPNLPQSIGTAGTRTTGGSSGLYFNTQPFLRGHISEAWGLQLDTSGRSHHHL